MTKIAAAPAIHHRLHGKGTSVGPNEGVWGSGMPAVLRQEIQDLGDLGGITGPATETFQVATADGSVMPLAAPSDAVSSAMMVVASAFLDPIVSSTPAGIWGMSGTAPASPMTPVQTLAQTLASVVQDASFGSAPHPVQLSHSPVSSAVPSGPETNKAALSDTALSTSTSAAALHEATPHETLSSAPAPSAPTVALATNENGTITASGFVGAGAQVTVTFPDGTCTTVVAAENGIYLATSTTAQTSGSVSAAAIDATGHAMPIAHGTYDDPTRVPELTVQATLNPEGMLMVTGHGEPGASVTITFPDGTTQTVVAGAAGDYCALANCHQPSGTIAAVATTAAGHVSSAALMPYGDGSGSADHPGPPDGTPPTMPSLPDLASHPGEPVAPTLEVNAPAKVFGTAVLAAGMGAVDDSFAPVAGGSETSAAAGTIRVTGPVVTATDTVGSGSGPVFAFKDAAAGAVTATDTQSAITIKIVDPAGAIASTAIAAFAGPKLNLDLVSVSSGDALAMDTSGHHSGAPPLSLSDVMQASVQTSALLQVFGHADSNSAPAFLHAGLSLNAAVLSAVATLPIDHMASAHIL